jgi:cytoskeletal protein RodZ
LKQAEENCKPLSSQQLGMLSCYNAQIGGSGVTAPGIGSRLKNRRIAKGLTLDDISRDTRIPSRYLDAIETEDHSSLPGLVFTRNFIRQYALFLEVDPEPLIAGLPKPDEKTAPLPDAPARPNGRSSYRRERRIRAFAIASAWLLATGAAGAAAYLGLHHYSIRIVSTDTRPEVVQAASPVPGKAAVAPAAAPVNEAATPRVTVSLTAHARAWIRLDADGKTVFMGTLITDETKEISAKEQIRLQTGNAGALSVSLNGKTLDSLGDAGQFREVRLTAEGPRFPRKDPPPQPSSDQL